MNETGTDTPTILGPTGGGGESAGEVKPLRELPGSEHIRPFATVRASDRIRLQGVMTGGIDLTGGQAATPDPKATMFAMADALDFIKDHFTFDADKFDAWCCQASGDELIDLITGVFNDLGEDRASTSGSAPAHS